MSALKVETYENASEVLRLVSKMARLAMGSDKDDFLSALGIVTAHALVLGCVSPEEQEKAVLRMAELIRGNMLLKREIWGAHD